MPSPHTGPPSSTKDIVSTTQWHAHVGAPLTLQLRQQLRYIFHGGTNSVRVEIHVYVSVCVCTIQCSMLLLVRSRLCGGPPQLPPALYTIRLPPHSHGTPPYSSSTTISRYRPSPSAIRNIYHQPNLQRRVFPTPHLVISSKAPLPNPIYSALRHRPLPDIVACQFASTMTSQPPTQRR